MEGTKHNSGQNTILEKKHYGCPTLYSLGYASFKTKAVDTRKGEPDGAFDCGEDDDQECHTGLFSE